MPDTTKQTMTSLRKQIADKMKNENILTRKISKLEDKIIQLQGSSPPTVKKRFGGALNKKTELNKAIQKVKNKTKPKTKGKLNPSLQAFLNKKKKKMNSKKKMG
tara:strand:+ start:584 stop:895 length:312 start_codon:yes stop_codon:yes gene_type:complete